MFLHVHVINLLLLVNPPAQAPGNIKIVAVSPNAVTATFDGVPDGNANGIVTGYTIYYQPIDGLPSSANILKMNISSSNRNVTITGLEENVVYRIWMTSSNSFGEGPLSTPITIKTEAGKLLSPHFLI